MPAITQRKRKKLVAAAIKKIDAEIADLERRREIRAAMNRLLGRLRRTTRQSTREKLFGEIRELQKQCLHEEKAFSVRDNCSFCRYCDFDSDYGWH